MAGVFTSQALLELTDEVNKVCEEQYGVSYYEMMEEIYDMWDGLDQD